MASIQSLLNPVPEFGPGPIKGASWGRPLETSIPRAQRPKRPRIAKDAPIFHKGKTRGDVRYPPCEERDEELARIHKEFNIHPLGDIAAFPRHIPYNSDKKQFQEQTGREHFEVFQYTFKIPGDDKEWIVMWDYNIGLVRTTHLFKCNGYSKTTPGKVLTANAGLRTICHSITGGSLAAQGYWMPYDAAKAIAATFCYKIRYALTPLFGLDFPEMCVNPLDRVRYGHMIIDPAIVQKSTEMANYYRMLELRSPALSSLPDPRPNTSSTERDGSTTGIFAAKKQLFPHSHRKHTDNLSTTSTASSGCSVSPDGYNSDTYCTSPISPCQSGFTPVNAPRSTDAIYYPSAGARTSTGPSSGSNRIPSPKEILESVSARSAIASVGSGSGSGSGSGPGPGVGTDDGMDTSSSGYSDVSSTPTDCLSLDLDDDNDEDYRDAESRVPDNANANTNVNTNANRKKIATRASSRHGQTAVLFAREVKAAHALLSLHMQEASGSDCDDKSGGVPVSVSSLMDVHRQRRQGHSQGRKRRRASA